MYADLRRSHRVLPSRVRLKAFVIYALAGWSAGSLAQQKESARHEEMVRQAEADRASLQACMAETGGSAPACMEQMLFPGIADLQQAIASADPAELFAVDLEFDEPVPLGRIRNAAIQLQIPRVLASPELVKTCWRGAAYRPRGCFAERRSRSAFSRQ